MPEVRKVYLEAPGILGSLQCLAGLESSTLSYLQDILTVIDFFSEILYIFIYIILEVDNLSLKLLYLFFPKILDSFLIYTGEDISLLL